MPRFYLSKRIGAIIEAANEEESKDRFEHYVNEATEDEFEVKVREIQPWEDLDEDELYPYWVDLNSPEIAAPTREEALKLAIAMISTGELEIKIVNVEEA